MSSVYSVFNAKLVYCVYSGVLKILWRGGASAEGAKFEALEAP